MSHGTSLSVKGHLFRAIEDATRGILYAGMVRPAPLSFTPTYGYEGMRYHGTITGKNLDKATAVSLGADITVESFDLDSKTQISVIFRTDAAPAAGYRDLTVYRGALSGVLSNAFNLVISDALIVPSKKPMQQHMEKVLVGVALAQYPYDRVLAASVRVQHTGFSALSTYVKVQHAIMSSLPAQAVVQVRSGRVLDSQVQIQKMADIVAVGLLYDVLAVEVIADQHLEIVDDFKLSLEDGLSATLIGDVAAPLWGEGEEML